MNKRLTRREMLKLSAAMAAGSLLAACAPRQPESVEVDATKEVPVTPKLVVEATPEAPPAPEPVEMRVQWWGPQDRHDATIKALELYEEQNPHVEISPEYMAFDAYLEKLATQVAGGNAPDVVQLPTASIAEYALRDALLELDDLRPDPINLEHFAPDMVDSIAVEGKTYAVGTGINSGCLFYDEDVFAEVGVEAPDYTWTWSDFVDLVTEISEAKGDKFWGTMDGGGYRGAVGSYTRGIGKSVFSEDGELGFTKEDLVEWFTYWDDLRDSGGCVPAEVMATFQERLEMHMIMQGKAAMDFTFASLGMTLQSMTPHPLGLLTMPHGPVTLGQGTDSGNVWCIYSGTESPQESGRVVNFLVNNPDACTILGLVRGVPPSSEIRALLRPEATPIQQKMYSFFDILAEHGSPLAPATPLGGSEVSLTILPRANEAVAFGRLSIEEAVDQVFSEAEKVLGEA